MASSQEGQATIELLAGIPLLLLAGTIALQLLVVGYSYTLADGAAEAGSLALAAGGSAKSAATDSLPAWARDRVEINVDGGEVTVGLRPPSLFSSLAERLAVTSTSYTRPSG